MTTKLLNILKKLPKSAGVYQFFDNKENIIYIWKSVNLKSRVNSYFNWNSKLTFAKQKMVEKIADIKYIIVENETESLILETNLIKEYLPKYNILMKDWKNHVYIKITNEEFPKIIMVRNKNSNNNNSKIDTSIKEEYFGPYISSNDIDNILKVLKKIFGYWVGKNNFFKNNWNYNLDEYLFKWKIQSNNSLSNNEWTLNTIVDEENLIKKIYFEKLEKIKHFLKWNYKDVVDELREEMMSFAMNNEFERADIIKKQIESIEILDEKQIIRDGIIWDYDVINYLEKFDKTFIWKIKIRQSKIIWFYPFEIENNLWEDIEEILKNFIKSSPLTSILISESNKKKIPKVIISKKIVLKEELFKNLEILNPKKWTKQDLLKMCYKNLYEFAYKKHIASLNTKSFTKQTMKNILELLWFERFNKDILFECNDISHLSWTHTVASRSIIENWKTNSSKYKKFRIKNLKEQEINDFDSMREIIERRLIEVEKLWNYPDLIIIDWWKWQLSSVSEVVEKYINLENKKLNKKIQLVWIAKKEEILYKLDSWVFSEYILNKDSLELRLIQKIRDEAHRFAITFNRDSRSKSSKKNILESMPWIGQKTRKLILKEFSSVENLSKIEKSKLELVLNKNIIEILENHGII